MQDDDVKFSSVLPINAFMIRKTNKQHIIPSHKEEIYPQSISSFSAAPTEMFSIANAWGQIETSTDRNTLILS